MQHNLAKFQLRQIESLTENVEDINTLKLHQNTLVTVGIIAKIFTILTYITYSTNCHHRSSLACVSFLLSVTNYSDPTPILAVDLSVND